MLALHACTLREHSLYIESTNACYSRRRLLQGATMPRTASAEQPHRPVGSSGHPPRGRTRQAGGTGGSCRAAASTALFNHRRIVPSLSSLTWPKTGHSLARTVRARFTMASQLLVVVCAVTKIDHRLHLPGAITLSAHVASFLSCVAACPQVTTIRTFAR